MNNRFCPKCGTPLPEGSLFCPECGADLRPSFEPAAFEPGQSASADIPSDAASDTGAASPAQPFVMTEKRRSTALKPALTAVLLGFGALIVAAGITIGALFVFAPERDAEAIASAAKEPELASAPVSAPAEPEQKTSIINAAYVYMTPYTGAEKYEVVAKSFQYAAEATGSIGTYFAQDYIADMDDISNSIAATGAEAVAIVASSYRTDEFVEGRVAIGSDSGITPYVYTQQFSSESDPNAKRVLRSGADSAARSAVEYMTSQKQGINIAVVTGFGYNGSVYRSDTLYGIGQASAASTDIAGIYEIVFDTADMSEVAEIAAQQGFDYVYIAPGADTDDVLSAIDELGLKEMPEILVGVTDYQSAFDNIGKYGDKIKQLYVPPQAAGMACFKMMYNDINGIEGDVSVPSVMIKSYDELDAWSDDAAMESAFDLVF